MSVTETEQKVTERRSENRGKKTSKDIFVIIFCILGIVTSLFLFQRDLFKTFRSLSMHPAGIVTVKYNTVMRLFSDMMVWDRLYTQSPVYNEDLVYMARLSGATLHLGDDRADGIELGEYTMIRIHNSSRIELISGSANISVRSNRRFQLVIGDSIIEASRGTVLNASSNDGFSLRVREGNAHILRDGQIQEVPAGSVIFMNAQGDGVTYSSQSAEGNTSIPTDRHQQLAEDNTVFTFTEVTEPVQTAAVEEAPVEVVAPAPQRQQQATPRLTLLSPANNSAIAGLTALRQPTTFRWDTDEEITSSRFVLSRRTNPAVGRAEVEINNPGRTLTVPRIGEGVWYWTVEGRTRDGRTVTASAPRQLRVQTIPLLPAPRNRLPASGFQIGADEFRQRIPIVFSWSQVSGANSYILTILKDGIPRKTQIFQTDLIRGLSYTLENYSMFDASGSYSWSIEAVFYNSNSGVIEQRGNPGENNFALNVPSPSRVRPRSTGVLYGTQ